MNDFRHSPSRPSDASKLNMDRIESTRGKLDELIEELNGKLFSHFHRKEQELLEEYKQELIAAQKELN